VIGDGQRITVLPVTKPELAFEVGAPQIIGAAPEDSGVPSARRRFLPIRLTRP
jgi:hypothetical protein